MKTGLPFIPMAKDCYDRGMDTESTRAFLMRGHSDELLIQAVVKQCRSDRYAIARKEGLNLLAIGCGLIVAGFLITCVNFHSNQSVHLAMYGLTTIGIAVVFWALYKFLG